MKNKKRIISEFLAAIGKKGGNASTDRLTVAQRKARATLAAKARWAAARKGEQ